MSGMVAWLGVEMIRAEEFARAASGRGWRVDDHPAGNVAVCDNDGEPVVYDEGRPTEAQAQHIALHDPAAVLRRVAADRQILTEHANTWGGCAVCTDRSNPDPRQWAIIVWPCRTVQLLAEGYGWTEDAS